MKLAEHVKIIEWITKGANLYASQPRFIFVVVICALTVSALTVGAMIGPMFGGVFLVLLQLIRRNSQNISNLMNTQTELPNIGDVFQGVEFFRPTMFVYVPLLLFSFITTVICMQIPWVGSIIAVTLFLLLGTFLMFVIPFIVDQNLPPFRAIFKSVKAVQTGGVEFLLFFAAVTFVSCLTTIFIWVGAVLGYSLFILCSPIFLIAAPLYFCSIAVAYEDLFFE